MEYTETDICVAKAVLGAVGGLHSSLRLENPSHKDVKELVTQLEMLEDQAKDTLQRVANKQGTITMERLLPIPAGDNPFMHDVYNMGTRIASNVIVMHATHPTERADYLIVVDTETGERVRLLLKR